MAYELESPSRLGFIHLVFHVSMLRKCVGDPSLIIALENIGVLNSLSFK